ncbi:Abi family protein [Helicobacter felis]|uniref:Abi family protein n=1 Tax=Helicobacter felis TaxID=214 RepID=UPI000CF15641|nr:Abi family protein [Helicobacter felis]
MFDLQNAYFQKIAALFLDAPHLIAGEFETKIKQSIGVLHHGYLWGACKEAQILLKKKNGALERNLFDLIMQFYNKRRNAHQASFLLLQCFENALRSTMAVVVANALNTNQDDWFMQDSQNQMQQHLVQKIDAIIALRNKKRQMPKHTMNSFDVFDLFSLGDLEFILNRHYYPYFESFFAKPKTYKNQEIPIFGTKTHALNTIARIRDARNEIFHNKPTKIKFKKDLEILLVRLGYNLQKACALEDLRPFFHLKFNYAKTGNG